MITEEQLENIADCDEYSLRHHAGDIQDLVDAYCGLIDLLETAGVMQLQDEWAVEIQQFIRGTP